MIIRQVISPAYLTAYEAGCPVIGWRNLNTLPLGVTATTADGNFPAANLANPATHLKWKEAFTSPISSADLFLTVAVPFDTTVSPAIQSTIDYVGIAKHNFGTAHCTVSVEATTDATSPITGYVNVVSHTPTTDLPIILQFSPRQAAYVRVKITAGSKLREAAVLYVGRLLTLERSVKLESQHTPINLGRHNSVQSGMAESGNFLGRLVKNQMQESTAEFSHFTPVWFRANFDPFLAASRDTPFFWAWHPDGDPTDTGYAWILKDPTPAINPVTGRFAVSLEMRGVA